MVVLYYLGVALAALAGIGCGGSSSDEKEDFSQIKDPIERYKAECVEASEYVSMQEGCGVALYPWKAIKTEGVDVYVPVDEMSVIDQNEVKRLLTSQTCQVNCQWRAKGFFSPSEEVECNAIVEVSSGNQVRFTNKRLSPVTDKSCGAILSLSH